VFRHCHHKNLLLDHVLSQFRCTSWRVYYLRQITFMFLTLSFSWNLFTFSHSYLTTTNNGFSIVSLIKSIIILTQWGALGLMLSAESLLPSRLPATFECEGWKRQNYSFTCYFWTWTLDYHYQGRTKIEGIWEQPRGEYFDLWETKQQEVGMLLFVLW